MSDARKSILPRILTAIIGLPFYLFAISTDRFNSFPVLIASLAVGILSLYEYYRLTDRGENGKAFLILGIIAGVIVNTIMYMISYGGDYHIEFYQYFDYNLIPVTIVLFTAVLLVIQLFMRPIKGGIFSTAVTVFGVFYIVFFFSHIILMKALENGFWYILAVNITVMINDSGAYFGGVFFGRHKTNFPVSPNKSWEGYFFGALASVISMLVVNIVYSGFFDKYLFSYTEAVLLGIGFSIAGNLGDLIESMIKRDSSKKDSGALFPGHGGMWDIFDAMIFTLPLFYYYLILKGIR